MSCSSDVQQVPYHLRPGNGVVTGTINADACEATVEALSGGPVATFRG